MSIPKTCFILASGASVRDNLWHVPIQYLPIWQALKDKFVVSINWGYKFINPALEIFVDYRFYATEKEGLDKLNLIIGKDDPFYIREKDNYSSRINDNLFLLKDAEGKNVDDKGMRSYYWNKESWKKGFYCGQLSGIWAISIMLQLGCENIYLLGYDANETNGYTHFYQDDGVTGHMNWKGQKQCGVGKDERGNYNTGTYNKDINWWFDPLKVEANKIINVNPNSAINTFKKISYAELYKILESEKVINYLEVQNEIKNIIKEKSCK